MFTLFLSLLARLRRWSRARRNERILEGIDEHLLRDIGVTKREFRDL